LDAGRDVKAAGNRLRSRLRLRWSGNEDERIAAGGNVGGFGFHYSLFLTGYLGTDCPALTLRHVVLQFEHRLIEFLL
jgi:hypothetical protein